MSIARIKKGPNPFVMIDHRPLCDSRLSWRARGILAYLLSKPDDWQIVIEHLIKQGTEGRDAVKSAFQELRELGYASLEVFRDSESGKVTGSTWTLFEIAQNRQTEKPSTGKPQEDCTAILENRDTGKPEDGKSATSNNDFSKNKKTTKNKDAGASVSLEMEEIVNAWNETGLPKCLKLTSARIGHLKARLKSQFWRDNWQTALALIAKSPFCTGKNDRQWTADFDFFTRSDDAVAKAMEGKYGAKLSEARAASNTDSVWQGDIWLVCDQLKKGEAFDEKYVTNKIQKAFKYAGPIAVLDYIAEQLPGEKPIYDQVHKSFLSVFPGEGKEK